MNETLKNLITRLAGIIPQCGPGSIDFSYGYADGEFGWSCTVGPAYKQLKNSRKVVREGFSGYGETPEEAAREVEARVAEYKNPDAAKERRELLRRLDMVKGLKDDVGPEKLAGLVAEIEGRIAEVEKRLSV